MRGRGYLGIVCLGLLVSGLIAGCATQPSAPPPPTPAVKEGAPAPSPVPAARKLERVRTLVLDKSANYMPVYLGKEKGVYKEEGIDLEITIIKAPLVVPALLSREADYAGGGSTSFTAGLQGLPVKALLAVVQKPPWYLFAVKEVKMASDLKGKVVAVPSLGRGAHWLTKRTLATLGVDPDKDVTIIAIFGGAEQLAALRAGSIAAARLTSPAHVLARKEGFTELAHMGEIVPYAIEGLETTEAKIKGNPDQVKRMIRAHLKSWAYMRDNPQETEGWLIRELGLDREAAKATYEDIVGAAVFDGFMGEKAIQAWVDEARFEGAVKGEIDVKKGLDQTLLQEVLKELKLKP